VHQILRPSLTSSQAGLTRNPVLKVRQKVKTYFLPVKVSKKGQAKPDPFFVKTAERDAEGGVPYAKK
jgi:hypothetical protein